MGEWVLILEEVFLIILMIVVEPELCGARSTPPSPRPLAADASASLLRPGCVL